MGLAASQARLLTITSRQSDCEYQSMKYSHQKLELTRSMTDISNEYQNALDATKLVYDFYGTGDTSLDLSYGLMMTPSQLNGYMPTLLTDSSGKVVLSTAYAEAARYAGIPQEGLGCLPSQTMRDNFLYGLYASGLISQDTYTNCKEVEYSQEMGCGTKDLITTTTQEVTLDGLLAALDAAGCGVGAYLNEFVSSDYSTGGCSNGIYVDGVEYDSVQNTLTYSDLLKKDYTIASVSTVKGEGKTFYDEDANWTNVYSNFTMWDFWDQMFSDVESLLDTGDPEIERILADARAKTEALIYEIDTDTSGSGSGTAGTGAGKMETAWTRINTDYRSINSVRNHVGEEAQNYVGYYIFYNRGKAKHSHIYDGMSISVSNIFEAYLTYIVEGLNGYYNSAYYVDKTGVEVIGRGDKNTAQYADGCTSRSVKDSNLVTSDYDGTFTIVTDTGLNADYALISGFYDALFNQLCTRGWVENNNIQDTAYMQEMLQSGKLYLATCSDDGYYYQGNYSTNTYIKEVTDEDGIAKAEAKYNTEKLKIENKENIIDLKMKNLDTEISSLSTEYDTIKSLISKNVERSFKRYDA